MWFHLFFYEVKKCLFFICLCSSFIFSQNIKKADSFLKILKENKLSKKEKALTLRGVAYYHPNLNTALNSAKESYKIAEELKDPLLQAEALEEISHIENRLGNNSLSFQASLNALKIYESLHMFERQAASYTQLADNFVSNENYNDAIKYLQKAEFIYSRSDNKENEILTILNLGEAYRLSGDLDRAESSFVKTINLNKNINSDVIKGYSYGNLGMVYATQKKLEIAKEYLSKAINILIPSKDFYSISVYTAEIGKIYSEEGHFYSADGNYHEAEKNYENAEVNLLHALDIAKQEGLKEQIKDFSVLLTDYYYERKHYQKALEYQKLYQVYQDSLVNKKNIQRIEQIKAGYEIDKRESRISLLNTINTNQKYWVTTLIIGSILLLLFVYFLYKGNKKIKLANNLLSQQKNIIAKKEKEKTLLLRELNHRIKNNLQMISSLLSLQSLELTGHPAKEAIIAGKYRVEALSLVHRKLYQEDINTRIILNDYIEDLVLGLFYSYEAQFKPSFKIDNINVSLDIAVPLALIINELIINALKYAYKNIGNPKLKVMMSQNENYLDIEIIDNGIGFNTEEAKKNNSFGLKLIYSLIEQLEGGIQKIDSKNGTHWKMNVALT